jgi:hypothetical protein
VWERNAERFLSARYMLVWMLARHPAVQLHASDHAIVWMLARHPAVQLQRNCVVACVKRSCCVVCFAQGLQGWGFGCGVCVAISSTMCWGLVLGGP